MLDYIFLTVSDLPRSSAFYEAVLPVLGIPFVMDRVRRSRLMPTPSERQRHDCIAGQGRTLIATLVGGILQDLGLLCLSGTQHSPRSPCRDGAELRSMRWNPGHFRMRRVLPDRDDFLVGARALATSSTPESTMSCPSSEPECSSV